ncbi:MAG: HlyD family efflux transporter periplasmic adaptor subunit [Bradyrhizobium sp.]|uniref:HlyD family secretion protein n=1 Tax=Bradyrhizobium sp. TaxID=376 RepID=UPI0025BB54F7|nr:HlyD family efflux transporter periplasmic adaptor subunit [Bradyrhizobium sp.]MBI5264771.1 HlyD family efflux transporter periplasmic adaptor subunit [Bradyrhizobium sp.]
MVNQSLAASADETAPSLAPEAEATDAKGLQHALKERLLAEDKRPEPPHHRIEHKKPPPERRDLKRGLKIAAGLALIAVFGWLPLRTMWQTSSVEAVLNSRLVTLRSPIDGEVVAIPDGVKDEAPLAAGTLVLRVINSRGDRSHLDDLRRQMSRLENQRPSLAAKLAAVQASQQDLARQAEQFRENRILQLEARIAEIKTSIEAAGARREEASAAVDRASTLAKSGSVSTVELARLTRELSVAQQIELGARKRLDAVQVELTAAKNGTFLGDSYNDRPSSFQREEEMRQRAEEMKADLAHADAEIAWLANEITTEEIRYASRSEADIKVPITGRIWEMMTSPGEDVRAGQPLLKVLDCGAEVVTANVTERVYNQLKLGDRASFEPNDGGPTINGSVINMTGAAGAPANLAINPDALNKEPYRVTVAITPVESPAHNCVVGRTGRVVFSRNEPAP